MSERKRLLKWGLAAAKLAVLALLVWTIRATLFDSLQALHANPPKIAWGWLVVAGVFYLLGTIPVAVFWHQILLAAGEHIHRFTAVRAYFVSAVGKYVPGKAMVLILRAALMRESAIPVTVITAGVFFETLANMAVGSLVALLILLPSAREHYWMALMALGMFVVCGLPIVPAVFKFALKLSGLGKFNPAVADKLRHIDLRVLGVGSLSMAVGWWIQGLSLWATLKALPDVDGGSWADLPRETAVVALSTVAGFLALLPAGVGARELVTIELLRPRFGEYAAVAAILLRMVSVVSDVLVSVILYFVRPRYASAAPGPDSANTTAAQDG